MYQSDYLRAEMHGAYVISPPSNKSKNNSAAYLEDEGNFTTDNYFGYLMKFFLYR